MIDASYGLKYLILGDAYTGKTSLRRTFMGTNFNDSYVQTIGADFSYKKIDLDNGSEVNCMIWDLAAQTQFLPIHPQYYRSTSALLVVYDLTDKDTKLNVTRWIKRFFEYSNVNSCPILVIGNKMDLLSQEEIDEEQKTLDDFITELRISFPQAYSINLILTSAKTGQNVDQAFLHLTNKTIKFFKDNKVDTDFQFQKPVEVDGISAYCISFYEKFGPRIISKVPEGEGIDPQELLSAVSLATIIDFEDVVRHTQITGSFPWNSPLGVIQYIVFANSNPKARGGKALYIIGVVLPPDIELRLGEELNVMRGYFHRSMNEFLQELKTSDKDYVTDSTLDLSKKEEIWLKKLLDRLIQKVVDIVKSE